MTTPSNQSSITSTHHERYHAAHLTENSARPVVWKVLAEYLSSYVPPRAHVLELGAGYCDWINSTRAARKMAVDIWSELPKHVAADVQPLQHDLSQGLLPVLGEQQFDVVLASNLLEHFESDAASRLIAEVFACLRAGGRFIIIQPNFRYAYRHYFDDYTHRSIFTDVSLPNLLRSHGFQIERVQAKFMPYSMRNRCSLAKPWLIRAYLYSPIKPFAGQMLLIGQRPVRREPEARLHLLDPHL
jgi:SAM-dependent methyltransferase